MINNENTLYITEMEALHLQLHTLVNQSNVLQTAVNLLLDWLQSPRSASAQYEVKAVVYALIEASNKAMQTQRIYTAHLVVNQVQTLRVDIAEQELATLVGKVREVIPCKEAADFINGTANNFIASITNLPNDKNHALYKDLPRADKVAEVLCYSVALKEKYAEAKFKLRQIEEKSEDLLDEERLFVEKLKFNPDDLIQKLNRWLIPYQKHKENNGDQASELMYQEIKAENAKARNFFKKPKVEHTQTIKLQNPGCPPLQEFVNMVIVDAKKGQKQTESKRKNAKGFEKLTPAQTELFVTIYGDADQRKQYYQKTMTDKSQSSSAYQTPTKNNNSLPRSQSAWFSSTNNLSITSPFTPSNSLRNLNQEAEMSTPSSKNSSASSSTSFSYTRSSVEKK
jgi:hypothetical protein